MIGRIQFIIALSWLLGLQMPVALWAAGGNSALVIIDMQPYFASRNDRQELPGNKAKLQEMIRNQVEAIKAARKAELPVIFVEYDRDRFVSQGAVPADGPQSDFETHGDLKAAVEGYDKAVILKKTTDGLFDGPNKHKAELDNYLKDRGIGTLIVAGANGGACVQFSIQGALLENYDVIAFSQGIADFNFKDFIYPYTGYYRGKIKTSCPDCTFREVRDLEAVTRVIEKARPFAHGSGPAARGGAR